MAAIKRSKVQRERDLTEIARRYLHGETQAAIAESIGVVQSQISYDIKTLISRWRESSLVALDQKIAEELAKINELERTAWDAWQRSLGISEKTVLKRVDADSGSGQRREARVSKENCHGDPRYLDTIKWCVERRCRLFGLDAPKKTDFTTAGAPLQLYTVMAHPDMWDEPDDDDYPAGLDGNSCELDGDR